MIRTDEPVMRNGTGDVNLERRIREVIGAAIEVHRAVGPGYLESIYEEALCVELDLRGIPFKRQADISMQDKGHAIRSGIMDIVIDEAMVVELKAGEMLAPIHTAHVRSYLKATRHKVGLLINFNTVVPRHGIKRIVLSNP